MSDFLLDRDGGGAGPRPSPITVRIPEACRLTGIGRSKRYELIKAGDLEDVKVASMTLIPFANLERLVAGRAAKLRGAIRNRRPHECIPSASGPYRLYRRHSGSGPGKPRVAAREGADRG